MTNLMHNSFI